MVSCVGCVDWEDHEGVTNHSSGERGAHGTRYQRRLNARPGAASVTPPPLHPGGGGGSSDSRPADTRY